MLLFFITHSLRSESHGHTSSSSARGFVCSGAAADINAHCGSEQHQIDADTERMRRAMAWIFVHYAPKESPLVRKLPESFSLLSCRDVPSRAQTGALSAQTRSTWLSLLHPLFCRLLFQPVPVAAVGFPFARAGWIAPHVARLEKVMISNLQ